ncbi:MAG: DUF488 family protein [Candidatus Poribacteria bacterium]
MLYINSISNQNASIGRKFAICHEKIPGMPNVLELTPARELLEAYCAQKISFEEFEERFKRQMRAEYRKPQNRLKGLAEYSVKNDVTLHSPEENSENSYRRILAEIINGIWRSMGVNQTVIDLTISQQAETLEVKQPEIPQIMEKAETPEEMEREIKRSAIPPINDIAEECEFFSPQNSENKSVSCVFCQYYDGNIYACNKKNELLVEYHWEESEA